MTLPPLRPLGRTAALVALLALGTVIVGPRAVPPTRSGINAVIANTTDTTKTRTWFTCNQAESRTANAYFAYPLTEALPLVTPPADITGNNRTGVYSALGVSHDGTAGPCVRDNANTGSILLNGSTGEIGGPAAISAAPTTYSEEIWFKTGTAGGKLIGFGTSRTGSSAAVDRHIYMGNQGGNIGRLVFATGTATLKSYLTSPLAYNDNVWHHVVATQSSAGMRLYVDGQLVASNAVATNYNFPTTSGQGYWRIGYDNLTGWSGVPTNWRFTGNLAFAAAYTRALSATEVTEHYLAGRP